jgi:protein-tyrosine phosphatase
MGLSLSSGRSREGGLNAIILLCYEHSGFASVSFVDFFRNLLHYRSKRLVIVEPTQAPNAPAASGLADGRLPLDETLRDVRASFNFRLVQAKGYRLWICADAQYASFVQQIRAFPFGEFRSSSAVSVAQLFSGGSNQLHSVCDALRQKMERPSTLGRMPAAGFRVNIRSVASAAELPALDGNCNAIMPGLYVGDETVVLDSAALARLRITHVVSLSTVFTADNAVDPSIKKCEVCLSDGPFEEFGRDFWDAVDFINDALTADGVVLIHCRRGISRSPALCIAFLMTKKGYSFDDALDLLRKKRPSVVLNPGFVEQLRQKEKLVPTGVVASCRSQQ